MKGYIMKNDCRFSNKGSGVVYDTAPSSQNDADIDTQARDEEIRRHVHQIAQQIRAAGDNDFTPIKDYINSLS